MEKLKWWEPPRADLTGDRERGGFGESAGALSDDPSSLAKRVRKLERVIESQQVQLGRYGAVLKVVADALAAGELDGKVFAYRLDAAIEAFEVSSTLQREPATPAPARPSGAPKPPMAPVAARPLPPSAASPTAERHGAMEICVSCGQEVPRSQTVLTESGPACDRCYGIE